MNDLREILDRIDVVVVRGADEIDSGLCVTGERHFLRDLARRKMSALAWLGALADLDLEVVRGVREQRRDPEASACDLLTAVSGVAADQVRELAALAIHAEEVETGHGLRIRAVRRLALRAERH